MNIDLNLDNVSLSGLEKAITQTCVEMGILREELFEIAPQIPQKLEELKMLQNPEDIWAYDEWIEFKEDLSKDEIIEMFAKDAMKYMIEVYDLEGAFNTVTNNGTNNKTFKLVSRVKRFARMFSNIGTGLSVSTTSRIVKKMKTMYDDYPIIGRILRHNRNVIEKSSVDRGSRVCTQCGYPYEGPGPTCNCW